MLKESNFNVLIGSLLLILVLFINSSVYSTESYLVDRRVNRTQSTDTKPDFYDQGSAWPGAMWPTNVWWVPLEFDTNHRDVAEAIITPVGSIEGWRGYEIKVGPGRKNIKNDELTMAQAVGRLIYRPNMGMNWTCTATHVGNGYVVTAGHCVADPKFTADACSGLQVEWDYRKSRKDFPTTMLEQNSLVGQCQEIISWQFTAGDGNTIDHAIFRVDNAPTAKVDIEPKPTLKVGDEVHQFSHPGGFQLIWSDTCKITDVPFQYYQHDCWSASGSSGSALIDVKKGTLVGVLSMGLDSTHFSVRNDKSPIGCFDVNTGKVNSLC